ncbi:MAG TPA: glutamine synthetase family protein [Miltoncostaeaceae bacterium]|jgi:glutamine synthetase|nr:glutamine synthetase family protein [Miltoncostaeaceae bacterium]
MTHDEVLRTVAERDVKFIRLWFSDILGRLKSVAIPVEQLPATLEHGIRFDGSSITGFNPVEESDMVAMPDARTFTVLPYRPQEQAVARMICDVRTPLGDPYEGDPRYVLRRAEERARSLGFEEFLVAPDMEFFYFRDSRGTEPLDEGGYFDLTTLDAASDVRRATVLALEQVGIDVAYSHHESGPSQHEIDIRGADALRMADQVMTYRTIVKEIAHQHGWYATFMPKPIYGRNGSGMHTNFVLMRDGRSAFHDPADELLLSEDGRRFVAGVLRHAREICCVMAQWVNSYKRLVPGYEAPVYVGWSRRNRSAIVRLPGHPEEGEDSARPELRCPDPACNPYLAFAALLHAGLEGIEHGYELPPAMETNLYHLTHEERLRAGVEALPTTLGEAIELGAASELLLKAFGEHIHARLVEIKRGEWEEYNAQVTPFEIARHLPLL